MTTSTTSTPLRDKSYLFALNVVSLCKHMADKKEFVLSKQLIRSGTSIGANIEEAQHSQSRKDFVSRLSISLKEAYESRFWVRLIHDTHSELENRTEALLSELNEIIPMLISSIKTAKANAEK